MSAGSPGNEAERSSGEAGTEPSAEASGGPPGPADDETRSRWHALVSSSGTFSGLPEQVVERVVLSMREQPFVEGDLLMAEGAPGSCLMVLCSGSAEVSLCDRQGVRHTLATVGELSLTVSLPLIPPSGVTLYFQDWVTDTGGPAGFAASNAVAGLTP